MGVPSIRFPESIIATTFVDMIFLLSLILSFAVPSLAQTTILSTTIRPVAKPTTSTGPPYSILPFFLPDSEPLSLVASVIHKTTIITTTIISPKTTVTSLSIQTINTVKPTGTPASPEEEVTLRIDCPTALTPENEACRSARIYPALVTGRRNLAETGGIAQTQVWKSETTYLLGDDATTTWTCWQGMSMRTSAPTPTEAAIVPLAGVDRGGGMVPYAQCVSTIVEDQGSSVRFVTRRYDECYFYKHMAPLIVADDERTAADGSEEAGKMNDGWERKLAGLGCDVEEASRTMWAGSVKTHAPVATETASAATSGGLRGVGKCSRSIAWAMTLWPLAVALMGSWIQIG